MNELDIHKESLEDMTTRIINKFEQRSGEKLGQADEKRILLETLAYALFIRNEATNEGNRMNFLRYSKGAYLDGIGEFVDTKRLPQRPSKVSLKFILSAPQHQAVSYSSIRVSGNGLIFSSEPLHFKPGVTEITVIGTCTTDGIMGNGILPGEITQIVDPKPYIASVINTDTSQGGAEIEDDDHYRKRIKEASSKFTTAGPVDAYEYWIKSYSTEIIDVDVKMTTPGTVKITPLMKGGELPTSSILKEIEDYLTEKKVRPLTDHLVIAKPTEVTYNLDVTYFISNKDVGVVEDIKKNVNKAFEKFILWQKSKLKRDINPSKLISDLIIAGAKRVEVTSPSFKVIGNFEVAKEGSKNLQFGGLEDD